MRCRPYRPTRTLNSGDLGDESLPFRRAVGEDDVLVVTAQARRLGRDHDDVEPVDFLELFRRRLCRGGHAAQPRIVAQEVLYRDRVENPSLALDFETLLAFDGSLQPVRPPPSVGHPPREVVDQLHLAAADDVVDVAVEEAVGMQGVLERNQEMQVVGIVPALRSAGGMPSWTQPTVKQSIGRRGPSRRRLGARGNR